MAQPSTTDPSPREVAEAMYAALRRSDRDALRARGRRARGPC
ncbi:hypothetical protein OG762_05530 [Streptomyces sp. NBC_01136]|nr:hypothetical protein OG762_05530 [Streptomyces sp. NBC_01136]